MKLYGSRKDGVPKRRPTQDKVGTGPVTGNNVSVLDDFECVPFSLLALSRKIKFLT